jgi:ribosome recycling factor
MNMNVGIIESGNLKQFEKEIESQMDKHIKHFEKELQKLRTGRAHPSMVEDIRISAYGTTMALKEVGSISVPDAALIVIQPWDKSIINEIEKAVGTSDLGITPQNDGDVIRIKLPPMSSSRREE